MELRGHLAFHIGWQPYQCNVCHKSGCTEQEIISHFEDDHPNEKLRVCLFTNNVEKSKNLEEMFEKSLQSSKNRLSELFQSSTEDSSNPAEERSPTPPPASEASNLDCESFEIKIPKTENEMDLMEYESAIPNNDQSSANFTKTAADFASNSTQTDSNLNSDGIVREKEARIGEGKVKCNLCGSVMGREHTSLHVWRKHVSEKRYFCTGCLAGKARGCGDGHLRRCTNPEHVPEPKMVDRCIENPNLLDEYKEQTWWCFGIRSKRSAKKNDSVECCLCKTSVGKSLQNLRMHVWKHHVSQKRYACTGCDHQSAEARKNHFKACKNPKKAEELQWIDLAIDNPTSTTMDYRDKFEQCFGVKLKKWNRSRKEPLVKDEFEIFD